jgi:hypothetical protein
MANMDELFGKIYKYIWVIAIVGSGLVMLESILNMARLLEACFSLGTSIAIVICMVLSRYDVHGTAFAALAGSVILLLSPIGFSGFGLGILLILIGALISTSGGLYTYSSVFFYIAIGAVIVDVIVFLLP